MSTKGKQGVPMTGFLSVGLWNTELYDNQFTHHNYTQLVNEFGEYHAHYGAHYRELKVISLEVGFRFNILSHS